MLTIKNSPVQTVTFENKQILIKRDDLIHKDFSGNKARKFHYFLENKLKNIDTIVSYGSNQSNAMYSLSVLAKLKQYKFIYYVDHIPTYLEKNPQGNYKFALQNGMKIQIQNEKPVASHYHKNELFISEGGAIQEAKYGIKILADEIKEYKKQNNLKSINIFLPSGTGTTALFLQQYLDDIVYTCACVGNSEYLKKQFFELQSDQSIHPTILQTPKKFHFGKLYKENFQIWQKLKKQTNIEFDLLYDPIGWQTLLSHYNVIFSTKPLLYIHQGGLKGNETMILRYQYKFKSTLC